MRVRDVKLGHSLSTRISDIPLLCPASALLFPFNNRLDIYLPLWFKYMAHDENSIAMWHDSTYYTNLATYYGGL